MSERKLPHTNQSTTPKQQSDGPESSTGSQLTAQKTVRFFALAYLTSWSIWLPASTLLQAEQTYLPTVATAFRPFFKQSHWRSRCSVIPTMLLRAGTEVVGEIIPAWDSGCPVAKDADLLRAIVCCIIAITWMIATKGHLGRDKAWRQLRVQTPTQADLRHCCRFRAFHQADYTTHIQQSFLTKNAP